MDIFSFAVHFTDEDSCRSHFKAQRDKEGVVCNRCGGFDHYWLNNKSAYQCKICDARQTLRSGTMLEKIETILYDLVQDHMFDECY